MSDLPSLFNKLPKESSETSMATQEQVRRYLAYWFQLGKQIHIQNGQDAMLPNPVIQGDRYSAEFEKCWSYILSPESGICYLDGAPQTIDDLLSSKWDISPCARCDMPVPMIVMGPSDSSCPCSDLPNWPNNELPSPREPVNNQAQLSKLRDRLSVLKQQAQSEAGLN